MASIHTARPGAGSGTFLRASLTGLALLGIGGCHSGDGSAVPMATSAASTTVTAKLAMPAPVSGATCTLADTASSAAAASTTTSAAGVATFPGSSGPGTYLVSCQGGSYRDAATAATLTAPSLRSYVTVAQAGGTTAVTVSALSELAVRLAAGSPARFQAVRPQLATSFGLTGVDFTTTVPTDLTATTAGADGAGQLARSLAAVSQLQQNSGQSLAATLTTLGAGLGSTGEFTDETPIDQYVGALEELLLNPSLKTTAGMAGDFRTMVDNISQADRLAVIDYVDAAQDGDDQGTPDTAIPANQPVTVSIVGENLYLGLKATLNGNACRLHDVQPLDPFHERDDAQDLVFADCPAQTTGGTFVLVDGTQTVFTQAFAIGNPPKAARMAPWKSATIPGGGTETVSGTATALAPRTIFPGTPVPDGHHVGSLDYSQPETFPVAGVLVDLIDASGAVLATDTADGQGHFTFQGVPANTGVRVVVRAQVAKLRAGGATTGPQYNFVVRDNTSTTTPKTAYALTSAARTTGAQGGVTTIDVQARLGFNADGSLKDGEPRESAPFSILRVAESAAVKLEQVDPNLVLPDLNLYWSPLNSGARGDVNLGQVDGTLYANDGLLPGVYIVGKANDDTDEFDVAVIGHEFGHFLQNALSYQDSPGGAHETSNEFKDPSLAFSEGYGTGVGGLLGSGASARYHCASMGVNQADGYCDDLTTVPANETNGFYTERTIAYVVYSIGQQYGFTPFWQAITSLRGRLPSATVFAFLNNYRTQNPNNDLSAILATANIRTTDPYGNLNGAPADPAVDASHNKGAAASGAGDLEALYLDMTPSLRAGVAAPASGAVALSANEPTFCVNGNLRNVSNADGNGLGLSRRFTVVPDFDGVLVFTPVDDKGQAFDPQSTEGKARDDTGARLSVGNVDGAFGSINVRAGHTYSLKIRVTTPSAVFQGNRCGNRLVLQRGAAAT